MPIEVISERPSAATATPSSSVGPEVICSGSPPETLAPQVALPIHLYTQIHPLSIRRPCRRGASPRWTGLPPLRAAVQRNHATGLPGRIHFYRQRPLTVGRSIGEMHHPAFIPRKVDLPVFRTVFRCRHHPHMEPRLDFREQDVAFVRSQVSPAALDRSLVGSPPNGDIVYVVPTAGAVHAGVVHGVGDAHAVGENASPYLGRGSCVTQTGSPLGSSFT